MLSSGPLSTLVLSKVAPAKGMGLKSIFGPSGPSHTVDMVLGFNPAVQGTCPGAIEAEDLSVKRVTPKRGGFLLLPF